MSQKENLLKNTLDLIETDPEIKSYIYQQMVDFNPFVTPDTLVMVIARDPKAEYDLQQSPVDPVEIEDVDTEDLQPESLKDYKYRIAVVLKDEDTSIEAEAYSDDIFEAIRLAKENLLLRLIEIQNEIENPQDRIKAIQQASDNKPIH